MKIVVRSYKRSNTILKNTLGELRQATTPIYLVVADKEEEKEYKKELGDYPLADIIVASVGGCNAINKAIDYFPEGEPLVFMDDDLKKIQCYLDIEKKEVITNFILEDYFVYAFDRMYQNNTSALTFDYTPNLMFKQGKPFFEIRPKKIGGAWWGMYNDKGAKVFQSHNDDNIRTAYFLEKDGKVASLNWLTAITAYGRNAGGMQASGDRGESDRKEKTLELCKSALAIPYVNKYFDGYVYDEKAGCHHITIKHKRDLKKVLRYEEITYSKFFQNTHDNENTFYLFE